MAGQRLLRVDPGTVDLLPDPAVHDAARAAGRAVLSVGREGEDATSFWYSSQAWTSWTAVVASRDATVRRQAEVRRQRPIAPEGESSIS